MHILYMDDCLIVCEKPQRVLSTDEPGGLPDLLRAELGHKNAEIRTVHRLDRVVGGLIVVARNCNAASELSRQVREDLLEKEYCAVVHGIPPMNGTLKDLLYRDKARKMTFVAEHMEKGVQEAILDYSVINTYEGLSRIRIRLHTGRTHQIRVQFSSRGYPLVGERKYSALEDACEIALWSTRLAFYHPVSKEKMEFRLDPPDVYPWNLV